MDIKCTQNIFKSASGSASIAYYILVPEGVDIRGVVQISHGMCDYFNRYTPFAKYLCSLGFVVCGNDHLGHGSSVSRPGELGFFAPKNGWKFLVEDLHQLTDIMRLRYPDLPYFLLGHSMGSLIVRLYLAQYDEGLSGAVICGTVGPTPLVKTGISIADSIARSKGMTYRSAMLSKLALGSFNRKIDSPRTCFDWISRDDQVVDLFQSDEKCNFIFTATGFRDLFQLVMRANHTRCFKATPHKLPLLLIAGDRDPVGGCGDGVRTVAKFYRAAGQKNVDVIFYKDSRHELLNELNRLDVYGDISRWLENCLAAPPDETPAPAT